MYSFLNLGNFGRLGNQMFQYAALFSISKKNKTELLIPNSKINSKNTKYELLQAFENLSANVISLHDPKFSLISKRFHEKCFSYDKNFFLIDKFTDLHGYFQSENYFKDFKSEIKKEFSFSKKIIETCDLKIIKYKKNNISLCSIHVRRGDYTNLKDYHTNLKLEDYYKPSIKKILENNNNIKFIVFSDDVEWCKKNKFLQENCIFLNTDNHFEDLYLMTQCDYHIIANSSFSWWGSYLSNTKLTIAPKHWFGPQGPKNWSSIYCDNWHII